MLKPSIKEKTLACHERADFRLDGFPGAQSSPLLLDLNNAPGIAHHPFRKDSALRLAKSIRLLLHRSFLWGLTSRQQSVALRRKPIAIALHRRMVESIPPAVFKSHLKEPLSLTPERNETALPGHLVMQNAQGGTTDT
jgi:hypothetical protein